jgi:hypothetical protein
MNSLREEKRNLPRWWLSPEGELLRCDDHEFTARQLLRANPSFVYKGRKETYAQMFEAGWVRLVTDPNLILFDAPKPMTRKQHLTLRDLAVEHDRPLYDTIRLRILNKADQGIPSSPPKA